MAPQAEGLGFSPLPGSPYATTDPPLPPSPGGYLGGMTSGDFNDDGVSDVAVVESVGSTAHPEARESVAILLGSHDEGLALASEPIPIFSGGILSGAGSIATDDFNHDGNADLAVVDPIHGAITILLGDGHGAFAAAGSAIPFSGTTNGALAVGDFNDDGKQDIAVVGSYVTVLLGDGHGGFAQATGSPMALGAYGLTVATGDFNDDGRTDLAVRASSGELLAFVAGPSGELESTAELPLGEGASPDSLATEDLNHDGKLDLAMANGSDDSATVLLGDGHGGFSPAPGSPFPVPGAASQYEPGTPQSIGIGDFDDDAIPDLAFANFNGSSDSIAILQGDGTGAFTSPPGALFPAHGNPRPLVIGDFNGDGEPDIAAANSFQGRVTVLANCGATGCPPPVEQPPYERPAGESTPYEPPIAHLPAPGEKGSSEVKAFAETTGGGKTTAAPAEAPSIRALSLARRRIRRGHSVLLTIELAQDATVVVELRKTHTGRRRGHARGLGSLGSVTLTGHRGANTVRIGRMHGHALAAGRYLLVVLATAGGASSNPKVARLTVVR